MPRVQQSASGLRLFIGRVLYYLGGVTFRQGRKSHLLLPTGPDGALWHSTLTLNMICLSGSQIFSKMGRSSGFLLMTGSAVNASRDCELDHAARRMHGHKRGCLACQGCLQARLAAAGSSVSYGHPECMRPASPLVKYPGKACILRPEPGPKAKTAGTHKSQLTHCLKHLLHSLQQRIVSVEAVLHILRAGKAFMHRHAADVGEACLQELLLVWIALHDALEGSLHGGAEDSDLDALSADWHGMCS